MPSVSIAMKGLCRGIVGALGGRPRPRSCRCQTSARGFPDLPTLTECGYANSDVPIWYLLFAPAGTATAIVAKLNAKIVEIANSEEMRERMRSINTVVPTQTPEAMVAYLEQDTARNIVLIKATNMKLE
jgi:tripartite-type tricarboxylate transporter receptor subunit TctC